MCICKLNFFFGRFGNNIQQLAIISHFAFIMNFCQAIVIPRNNYFISNIIKNNNINKCLCKKQIFWKCRKSNNINMFFFPSGSHKPNITLYELKLCIQKFVMPIIKPSIYKKKILNILIIYYIIDRRKHI